MKFLEFLLNIQQNKKIPVTSLICFRSQDNYPLLFFSLLFSWLRKEQSLRIVSIDVEHQKESLMQAQLETSFLGSSLFYWLGNFSKYSKKMQNQWIAYLQKYQGPHTVAFFLTKETSVSFSDYASIVTIPSIISYEEMLQLQQLFFISSEASRQFIEQVTKKRQKISLDLFCLFLNYGLLSGKSSEGFFSDWIDHLLPLQPSLFELSQYFFAKNRQQFFLKWVQIHNDYNAQFWVTFWSEQLWRAALWTNLSRNKSFNEAKKIQFKLPFSFLRYDWKKYYFAELQSAHQFITSADYHLKNNSSVYVFDLFFSKFFLNQFA
jgi:hypothetical protein